MTKTLRLENDDLASELRDLYEKLAEAQGLLEALQHRLFLELFSYIAHVFNLKHLNNWSWPWFLIVTCAPKEQNSKQQPLKMPWRELRRGTCSSASLCKEPLESPMCMYHITPPLCEGKEAS